MRAEAGERPGDGGSPAGPERGGAAGKFRADRNGFPLGWEENRLRVFSQARSRSYRWPFLRAPHFYGAVVRG